MDHYEILELQPTATQDEVKAAYKKMATLVHPDKGGSAMLFRLVQEAYEVLSDPVKRQQHDSDLAGSTGASRQSSSHNNQQHQQQDTHAYQSEPNFTRVEDLYKRWREDRNRVAMPRSESYAAGGVRKMIRESSLLFMFGKLKDAEPNDSLFCGNCGYVKKISIFVEGNDYVDGKKTGWCERCSERRGFLRKFLPDGTTPGKFNKEKVDIQSGDLLFFANFIFFHHHRASFGYVVEGRVKDSLDLKNLKVLDEFTGQLLSPNEWGRVMGHWKSNDLSKNRTGSLRNWSI